MGRRRMLLSAAAAAVCSWVCGCDPSALMAPDSTPAASPPPSSQTLNVKAAEDAPPETVLPILPAEPAAALTPLEIAARLLPAARPGNSPDSVRGQFVVRLVDSYQTAAGVSARLAVVNVGDDADRTIQITELIDESLFVHPVSIVIRDGTVSQSPLLALHLPRETPLEFTVLWKHPASKVIGGIEQIGLVMDGEPEQFVFRRPLAQEPPLEMTSTTEMAAAVRLLSGCTAEAPGTAYWQKGMKTGQVALQFSAISAEGGAISGEFFIPGDRQARKEFQGELTLDPDTGELRGFLETVMRSGMPGRPVQQDSTWNLLLRGTTAKYSLRLYGHELYGESEAGYKLSLTPMPPDPNLAVKP